MEQNYNPDKPYTIGSEEFYTINNSISYEGRLWYTATKYAKSQQRGFFKTKFVDPQYTRLYCTREEHPTKKELIKDCIQTDKQINCASMEFDTLSPHLKELVLMLVHNGTVSLSVGGVCKQEQWFRGLDVKAFSEELQFYFKNSVWQPFRINDSRSSIVHLFLKKYVDMDGNTRLTASEQPIIELRITASSELIHAIDWSKTNIDPISLIGTPCPKFEMRDADYPELVPIFPEEPKPQPQIVYVPQPDDNKPRCPTCRTSEVERVRMVGKLVSIELFGLASNKIGKQFKCKKCGYMW